MIQAHFDKSFESWRQEARKFLLEAVPPTAISWSEEQNSLFVQEGSVHKLDRPLTTVRVPADFVDMAEAVACARDEDRWDLLYRILYRLQHENHDLLKIAVDPDVARAQALRKSVRRDIHKMHAFVRFKKTMIEGKEVYLAWHKPEHRIFKIGTPFFARRFGDKKWTIFTPDGSAHWDLEKLSFGPGMEQHEFQVKDDWDEVWKTYYKSIFNPARIKLKAMRAEMATKYWSSMPETTLIHQLVREAPKRVQDMAASQNTSAAVDPNHSLRELKIEASKCKACPIHWKATQTVFGVGPENARIMIIGEQPGELEDISGIPFVGPAGEILNDALHASGIPRQEVYLTNAVKHFKWQQRGKTRLHQKPSGSEMHACKPWLEAEIARVKPRVIVALGTTAATAVMGRLPKISAERGRAHRDLKIAPVVIVSWHPAAILRSASDAQARERQLQLAEDLKLAAEHAELAFIRI